MIFILNIYKWEKKGFSPVLFLLFILNYIKKCVWLRWRMRNTESGKKNQEIMMMMMMIVRMIFIKTKIKKFIEIILHWPKSTRNDGCLFYFFRIIIGRYIVASLCVCACVCKFWLKILHFFSKKSVTHIFFLDLLFWRLFSHFTIDNRSWNCFFFSL